MGEAGNGEKQTDTRTPVAAAPAGWGFELPPRWRLERLLGQGGQAEVWLAMDERLGELVAVKIFHPAVSPAALGRLRREVRLGRSLQHSNLVGIYELIEAGGRLALAMEWLPQGNLAAKLERDGPLATAEVVAVAQQVLVALEHLEAHGVVHRDIKPSNLLLDAQGRVKVGDLGLVKVAEDGEHITQTATPAGHFRTTQLLTRVDIERRDRTALENAIADWPAVEPAGAQAELRARADLWWDDLHDEDCEVRSFDTAPDGEAVACLARWRLGKTRPTDPDAMADAAKRNPDAVTECDLARAMALLALGRTSAAVQATLSVVTYLKPRCAYDFMLYQVLELARACNTKALLAAGRREEAIREAELLHASLRPGLLPAILVGEVLRDGASGPAGR